MLPLIRQTRYLGRYREIARVLGRHGFGYLVEQLGLLSLLSLPRRAILRAPAPAPLSSGARLREAFVTLGPSFVKLGQMLSTRPDLLPREIGAELALLQDAVPPFPSDQAIALIERELQAPLAELFADFTPEPLAAASLGQVHAATLPDGREVVVKVQRPEIAAQVALDLAILSDLAALAEERLNLGARYDLKGLAWEFGLAMRAELDYRREGRNAERFQANFAEIPFVKIPDVHWRYSSSTILTTERLYGAKLTDAAALDLLGVDRPRLARESANLILREVFHDRFYHADPHPGNFFALPDGRLGMVDFGQVGSLEPAMSQALLQLLASTANRDSDGMLRALDRLDLLPQHEASPRLRRDLSLFCERFVDRSLADLSARETLDELVMILTRHQIRLPSSLASLLKALVMVEGLGLQLDPEMDIFAIARPYAIAAIGEQFGPGAAAARLSSESRDLAELALRLPRQLSRLLNLAEHGNLHLGAELPDLRRIAAATVRAANRLAAAIVLAALIMGITAIAITIGMTGWSGWLPTLLITIGSIVTVVLGVGLALALLRRD